MPWYPVTKRINGRRYLYLQMTYREGGKVRTKNKYIGPAGDGIPFSYEPRPAATISADLEKARVHHDILRDTLRNHPAKFFIKLRGNLARQSIGGDSFAELNATAMDNSKGRGRRHEILKNLDTYLSEHGFADFDELDESVGEYLRTREELDHARQTLKKFREEQVAEAAYHRALGTRQTPESVTRPVAKPKQKPVRQKPEKLARDTNLDPIRRYKPKTRAVLRRAAIRRQFAEIVRNINIDILDAKKGDYSAEEAKEERRLYRTTYRRLFKRTLKAAKGELT